MGMPVGLVSRCYTGYSDSYSAAAAAMVGVVTTVNAVAAAIATEVIGSRNLAAATLAIPEGIGPEDTRLIRRQIMVPNMPDSVR